MSTGPVEVSPAVHEAQRRAFTSPHWDGFWTIHDRTLGRLRDVLETQADVLLFPGSIRAGLSVAVANLVGPGSRVLVITNGYWGDAIGALCAERGAECVWLRQPPLEPIDPAAVAAALAAAGRIDLVTMVHVETNVGVANPVGEVGCLVRQHGALYLVDTACSAGAMKLCSDAWCIDVGVTGSHKGLAAVPGLAVVSVGERAWQAMARSPREPGHHNLAAVKRHTVDRAETPPYTQPAGLVCALHAALEEMAAIGRERWYELHRQAAAEFRGRMRALGLRLLPDLAGTGDVHLSDTVMAVAYPDGVDDARFRRILRERFGIFVIGNVGVWQGRSFRAGLMSAPQIEARNMLATAAAIEVALRESRP